MPNRNSKGDKWIDGWIKHHSNESEDYIDLSRCKIENRNKIRVVCCSDTHGNHRKIDIPNGDIFIHAGDFTRFGKLEDAVDFNNWLGEEEIFGDFKLKVVVNGNHESNAPWQDNIGQLLSNAIFLKNDWCEYTFAPRKYGTEMKNNIKIYGTDFYWPMKTRNPYYERIPDDVDILICHAPVKGYVDGSHGCPTLLNRIKEINKLRAFNPLISLFGWIKKFILILIQMMLFIILFPSIVILKTAFSNFNDWPKYFKVNLANQKLAVKDKFIEFQSTYSNIISTSKRCFFQNDKNLTNSRPDSIRLVVSGHIHESHGISKMERMGYKRFNTTFVNAAIAKDGYKIGCKPIVVDL